MLQNSLPQIVGPSVCWSVRPAVGLLVDPKVHFPSFFDSIMVNKIISKKKKFILSDLFFFLLVYLRVIAEFAPALSIAFSFYLEHSIFFIVVCHSYILEN